MKEAIKVTLLLAAGINVGVVLMGVALEAPELVLLGLISGTLCVLGYTNKPNKEE